jgi:hypothetical protein
MPDVGVPKHNSEKRYGKRRLNSMHALTSTTTGSSAA